MSYKSHKQELLRDISNLTESDEDWGPSIELEKRPICKRLKIKQCGIKDIKDDNHLSEEDWGPTIDFKNRV